MPLYPESDLDLNKTDIDKFLIFLTVICTPRYDKWLRIYDFLNLTGPLKFYIGQNQVSREI
jgi:hypothetical protein